MIQFANAIEKYAELVVRVGVNLQPEQHLFITADISPESVPFVRHLVTKGYEAGARRVFVKWGDAEVQRITMERAPLEGLRDVAVPLIKWEEELAEKGAAFIQVHVPHPGLMKGIDPSRMAEARKAAMPYYERLQSMMGGMLVPWVIVSIPSESWAAKVFPDLPAAEGVERLWQNVLHATRATMDDPVQAWREHLSRMESRTKHLNSLSLKRLHYRAPGTDLSIELPPKHRWISVGGTATPGGVPFAPNIPSEEVFTLPAKNGVNGTVRSTLPLSYSGVLINDICLRFENGRIVEYSASSGEDALRTIIETDEGAHYLGEVALVPVDSPIYQLNTLFYDTLFDENASCHLAIGDAVTATLEGGPAMSKEQLAEHNANCSMTHVDFMIGSEELDIDGETADGQMVAVFRKGRWAL